MVEHLAQFNVARLRAPIDHPSTADFTDNLTAINDLAKGSPGFVWVLEDGSGSATSYRPYPGDEYVIVNLSVWTSLDALRAFVYKSAHVGFLRRRSEWFERMDDAFMVLWPVPAGTLPTLEDAVARLDHLRMNGPTPHAYGWRDAPEAPLDVLDFPDAGGAENPKRPTVER